MPTYDYECKICHHVFEAFHGISQKYDKKCPKCEGAVQRKISGGSGLIFKGSGFYSTDYKKSSTGSTVKANDSKSESSCGGGDSSKCSGCPNRSEA